MKKDITDFTEDEFIAFMHKILAENVGPNHIDLHRNE